jgi:RNA polymerase sigma-70 factor, ECF subfamily
MNQQFFELTRDCESPVFGRVADEDLAKYAQQGDQRAFVELVDRNYQRCFQLARKIMRNQDDAEDQVQSAFLRAQEHLDQFRYRARFSSWLSKIVINQCHMRFRERLRTRSLGTAEDCCYPGSAQIRDAALDPEQGLLERDLWDAVKTEIRLLPAVYREALVLRYLDQLPLTDLADRLGVTLATVKSRLFRAKIALRRRMLANPRSGPGRRPVLKAS